MGKTASLINKEHLKRVEISQLGNGAPLIESIDSLIKEEFDSLVKEVDANRDTISTKLESLRKDLVKEGKISLRERGSARQNIRAIPERRIPIATVSELIDIPINELTLYFLNGQRVHEGAQLVEYRLGCVYFYDLSTTQI